MCGCCIAVDIILCARPEVLLWGETENASQKCFLDNIWKGNKNWTRCPWNCNRRNVNHRVAYSCKRTWVYKKKKIWLYYVDGKPYLEACRLFRSTPIWASDGGRCRRWLRRDAFRHFLFIPFVMGHVLSLLAFLSFHAGIRITLRTTSIETHLNRSKSYRRIYQIETLEVLQKVFFYLFLQRAVDLFVASLIFIFLFFPYRSNCHRVAPCVCLSVWCCSGRMCRSFLRSHESELFGKPRCCKNFYYYDYFYDFLLLLLEFCVRVCVFSLSLSLFLGNAKKARKGLALPLAICRIWKGSFSQGVG